MDGLLSHSRCIQCLSKALKCKTDGGANKDQRRQAAPPPPGPLSSHARRCCHSESRLCSVQAYCSQPPPFPPAEGTPLASNPFTAWELLRGSASLRPCICQSRPRGADPSCVFRLQRGGSGEEVPSSCCRCLLKPEFTESNQSLHNSSCTRPTAGGFYFLAVLKSAGQVFLG